MVDSDNDGMPDDAEMRNGTNPDDASDADADADGDGLTNGDEVAAGTGVNNTDTDGDGVSDTEEVRLGYNPLDPNSTPPPNTTIVSISIAPSSLTISINTIFGQQPVQLMVIGVTNTNTTVNLTASPDTTYQSLNPAVAVVDDFGQVAGVTDGLATVEARYQNLTAQTSVNIATLTPGGLSSLAIPGYANNVDVAGNYAYVAAGAAGLQVVNVSDRANPSIVGALNTPGNANDVRIVGNLAYVADGGAGLRIIDVSNPLNPIARGAADTPGEAQDVFVVANRAYVADGPTGLQIIDVSNPATPALLGAVDTPGTARGVAVAGNLAVVADDAGGGGPNAVQVIDVSNPSAPQIAGSVNLPGSVKDVAARNSLAYVAAFDGGMYVVDFSNPAAPFIAGSIPFGSPTGFAPRDIELNGDFAFAAEQFFGNAVPIVDIGNTSTPQYRGVIDFSALGDYAGTGIAVDSQFVYMTGESFVVQSENGVSGDTRLFIGRFQTPPPTTDTNGFAPNVSLLTPQVGQTVIAGSFVSLTANAVDDVYVAGVRFAVNGTVVATDSAPPYRFDYQVPVNSSALTVTATAFDLGGNAATAGPVTVIVMPDPAPIVVITNPPADTTLIAGQSVEFAATATDNVGVQTVRFFLNGVEYPALFSGTYRLTVVVPTGIASLTLEVEAQDNLNQVTRVSRTFPVTPDAGTTVTGRVNGPDAQPLANATVSVFDEFTGTTGADGAFTIANVPTIRGAIVARAAANVSGQSLANVSLPLAPVRGGVTDVGVIQLNLGATIPTALALADYTGDFAPDLFVGYSDRASLIYEYQSGGLTPSSGPALPFGAVTSGAAAAGFALPSLFVQLAGQAGIVNGFEITPDSQPDSPSRSKTGAKAGLNGALLTETVTTGLTGESKVTAHRRDFSGREVLAFLSVDGTALTVRFRGSSSPPNSRPQGVIAGGVLNVSEAFLPPVVLPVDPSAPLRSLQLADVNSDGLLDVLAVKQVSAGNSALIVYPRSDPDTFGAPLESPLTVRSPAPVLNTIDFALTSNGFAPPTVLALGDDRVTLYDANVSGSYVAGGEILLPTGQTPTGLAITDLNGDSRPDVLVTTRNAATGAKSLLTFRRAFDGSFAAPEVFPYNAPSSNGDTRFAVADWNSNGRLDVAIADGDNVYLILDVGPNTQSS